MENSWYLSHNGLHHFFCKCGEHNIVKKNQIEADFEIIDFKREEIDFHKIPNLYYPDHCCSVCGNERYLDMNALLFHDKTLYWSEVKWSYEMKVEDQVWSVVSFIKIPQFDNKIKKFHIDKIALSSYCIDEQGEDEYIENYINFFKKSMTINGKHCRFNRISKNEINKKISKLICQNPSKNIEWLKGEETNLKNLLFFLQNPKIRSQDMVYWKNKEYFLEAMNHYQYVDNFLAYILNHRKEKSLRKSQFNSYRQLMKSHEYTPLTDYIFSRTIQDVNHLNKALNINIEVKKRLFDGCRIEEIKYFIKFLKNFYSEKYIVQLWINVSIDDLKHYLVCDTISLFRDKELREGLNKDFKKTPLNIRAVHHEVTKYSRRIEKLKIKNEIFSYGDFVLNSEVTKEKISYRLPRNHHELYEWGGVLHNCLSSYKSHILNGYSFVFGLFVDNKLTYAIELCDYKILQLSAAYNRRLSSEEQEKVYRWHKEVYIKNFMEYSDDNSKLNSF